MKHIQLFEDYTNLSIEFEIPTEKYIEKVLKSMDINYSEFKLIAEGGYGFTIDLGNSVLKITTDDVEAYYAYKTLDINSPNLVKNYNVGELKSSYQYRRLYAIHQEKLITEFNSSIKNMIWYLNKNNPIIGNLLNGTLITENILEYFKPKFLGWTDEMILHCFDMIKAMYLEAQKYGLPTAEIHEKNVGFRQGENNLVYFDISSAYESHEVNIPIIQL